jgi:hypothetical protein
MKAIVAVRAFVMAGEPKRGEEVIIKPKERERPYTKIRL